MCRISLMADEAVFEISSRFVRCFFSGSNARSSSKAQFFISTRLCPKLSCSSTAIRLRSFSCESINWRAKDSRAAFTRSNCRMRPRYRAKASKATAHVESARNHHVRQNGARTLISNAAPCEFHTPSRFAAITVKRYLPGGKCE